MSLSDISTLLFRWRDVATRRAVPLQAREYHTFDVYCGYSGTTTPLPCHALMSAASLGYTLFTAHAQVPRRRRHAYQCPRIVCTYIATHRDDEATRARRNGQNRPIILKMRDEHFSHTTRDMRVASRRLLVKLADDGRAAFRSRLASRQRCDFDDFPALRPILPRHAHSTHRRRAAARPPLAFYFGATADEDGSFYARHIDEPASTPFSAGSTARRLAAYRIRAKMRAI